MSKKCEKFQFLQFLSYINNIYIKRMHFPSGIQLWAEKIWFVEKKWKKLIFSGFWSKIMLTSWLQRQIFCKWWKKFQKLLYQDLLEGLKWKVTKYEHATFNELEMADDKRLGGARGAPPGLFRVNSFGYPFNSYMYLTLNSSRSVQYNTKKWKKLIVQTWEPMAMEISKNTYQLSTSVSTTPAPAPNYKKKKQLSKSANCFPKGEL